jgi:HlyD family secretion protein
MLSSIRTIFIVAALSALAVGCQAARGARTADGEWQTEEASIGELTASVGATGTVRSNQSGPLAFETSGVVDKVLVQAGEHVRAGQVLVTLRESSLNSQVILAKADLSAAERELEELHDTDLAIAEAQLALANAQDALDDAQRTWQYQQEGYRGSTITIDAAEAELVLAKAQLDRAKRTANSHADRPNDDPKRAQAFKDYAAAQTRHNRALANFNWYTGHPTETQQAQLDAELALAEAQFAEAEKALSDLQNGPDLRRVAILEARIAAAKATMTMINIVAPFSGTVTSSDVMPGDLVTPGQVAFRLSDQSRLLVNVEVSEVDINKVQVGQPVTLQLDAVLDQIYLGEVVEVGLVGEELQGIVNFLVTVGVMNPDESIKPGMTAAVNIEVNRIENVLLIPNRAVRVREGERVVYLLKGEHPVSVSIGIGASSESYSELVNGEVSLGDLIILNPPTEFGQNGAFFGRP